MFALLLICAVATSMSARLSFADPSTTPIAKCDPKVEKTIDKFQCQYGRSGLLIETAAANGIEFVTNTTNGYYPDNVTCTYSIFVPNGDKRDTATSATVEIFKDYSDNRRFFPEPEFEDLCLPTTEVKWEIDKRSISWGWTWTNENNTTQRNSTVIEKCGSTYDPDAKILRNHIWYGNGITVEYACSLHEDAKTGPPSFFVKCAAGYCEDANLEKGAAVLKRIGYEAPKYYPSCVKKYQEFLVG